GRKRCEQQECRDDCDRGAETPIRGREQPDRTPRQEAVWRHGDKSGGQNPKDARRQQRRQDEIMRPKQGNESGCDARLEGHCTSFETPAKRAPQDEVLSQCRHILTFILRRRKAPSRRTHNFLTQRPFYGRKCRDLREWPATEPASSPPTAIRAVSACR